jgi:hypothetical protein
MARVCLIAGCGKPHMARGWCPMHWSRWQRHGDPLTHSSISGLSLRQRFQRFVTAGDPNECWEWRASKNSEGYGQLTFKSKKYRAHRLAWTLHNGREPKAGLLILHSCDRPSCVNPNHLREGTDHDNMQDCMTRKRHRPVPQPGEAHPRVKLNNQAVRDIRKRVASGESRVALAREYGVTRSRVAQIYLRKGWKHVE